MISEKNKTRTQVLLGIFIAIIFVVLYFFDPFGENKQLTIFDALIIIALVTVLSFVPKYKLYSYFVLLGYFVFIIFRYFV